MHHKNRQNSLSPNSFGKKTDTLYGIVKAPEILLDCCCPGSDLEASEAQAEDHASSFEATSLRLLI